MRFPKALPFASRTVHGYPLSWGRARACRRGPMTWTPRIANSTTHYPTSLKRNQFKHTKSKNQFKHDQTNSIGGKLEEADPNASTFRAPMTNDTCVRFQQPQCDLLPKHKGVASKHQAHGRRQELIRIPDQIGPHALGPFMFWTYLSNCCLINLSTASNTTMNATSQFIKILIKRINIKQWY